MSRECVGFEELKRMPGSCLRCGKVADAHSCRPPTTGIVTDTSSSAGPLRDREFEDQALRLIAQQAAHPDIHRLAVARLDWGDVEYGDNFNARGDDGVSEAADEAIDGIAWLLLHLQNRDEEGDVREHCLRACRALAEAHRELTAAMHLR